MAAGFYISKALALAGALLAAGALVSIIALSVLYAQEKSSSQDPSPTLPTTTTAATTTPAPGPQEPWQRYRLPDTLAPISYQITLWPRLTPNQQGLFIFTGNSTVKFTCVKDTDLILIHANKLNFTLNQGHHAQLLSLGSQDAPAILDSWVEVQTQYLVVRLASKLEAGWTYVLYTQFVGELADDLGGFYRSTYMENGQEKVLATTQMQPTDARKAFPCFDEPAMKAVFHLSIIHPPETVALSNAINYDPINITDNGQAVTVTRFHPTEVMSTYLLAFVVCEFGYISSAPDSPVLIRIWARKQAIKEGQGDYALEKTGPILSFFEHYYSSSYPLAKSDQIALPDFSAGAMENWGLITYRETALLFNQAFSSSSDKEWIATVISHELAHMWFGNLVTMRWWNDLWLNEGFATYVSYLGADSAEPTWNIKDLMVVNEVHGVMGVDALSNSHPLSSRLEDVQQPGQIGRLFDSITYSKGAAVLRMLSDFITEGVFTEGLKTYLQEFKYNSTVYTDLWNHLQVAVDKASPGPGLPASVEVIMNRWILQMGFPVVTVNTRTGRVSQKHFLLDSEAVVDRPSPFNYEWIVPISWMKTGVPQNPLWLTTKEATNTNMTIGGHSADWILVNLKTSGFYRVNYDQENWERLLTKLDTNHQDIPEINRAQLISDAFNLARAELVSTTLALRTTRFLVKERKYTPWLTASRSLNYYFLMLDRSPVYGPMQAYMLKQVEPLFNYYKDLTANWTDIQGNHTDLYNQVMAIQLACKNGLKACEDLTSKLFSAWMKDSSHNPIQPNLRPVVYCSAIAAGGQQEWDFAWSRYKNASAASEAEKLLAAMACSRQPWILSRYLQYCLDPDQIRKQDASAAINGIAANVVGQPLVWDFVRANWNYLMNDYGKGSISFSSLLHGATRRFANEFELKQLLHFQEELGSNAVGLDFEQVLERTRANMKWVSANKDEVLSWFTEEASKPKAPLYSL